MNTEYDKTSNLPAIFDSRISEMEKEICKVKNWSDKDIQELMNVLSADQINTLLQNEIQRIDDWFSKTYYHFKSYLIKRNFLKFDKNDFERLKSKMDFILGCLNEDTKFQQNNFYPNEIMDAIKSMEKNKYEKCTIQIIGKSFARCLLCMRNVNGNVYDHVLGQQHQSNLSNSIQIELLNSFHLGWSNIPTSLRINEIFFLPHSSNRTKCCICNNFIGYRELLVHLNGRNHQLKIPDEFVQPDSIRVKEKLTHNEVQCDICKVSLSPNGLEEHVKGRKHQEILKQLSSIPKEKTEDNKVECEICKVFVSRNGFQEHIGGRNHQKNLKQINIKLVEKTKDDQVQCDVCKIAVSRIGYQEHTYGMKHQANFKLLNGKTDNSQYECDVCKVQFNLSRDGLQEHINGKNHLANVYKLFLNQSVDKYNSEEESETDTEVSEVQEESECDVCQVSVSRDEFQKHVNGKCHQTYLKLFSLKYVEKKTAKNEFQCNVCKIHISGDLLEHVNGKDHQANFQLFNSKTEEEQKDNYQIRCDICKIVVKNGNLQEHINGRDHQSNLKIINPQNDEIQEFQCDISKILVTYGDLEKHNIGKSHQLKLKQLSSETAKVNYNQVKCDVCKIEVPRNELQEHVNGINHQTNLEQLNLKLQLVKINDEITQCNICKILVTHGGLQEHINGRNHQNNSKQLNPKVKEEKKDIQIQCETCKILVSHDGLQEHINGKNHQAILEQLNKKVVDEDVRSNLNQLSSKIAEEIFENHVQCQLCRVIFSRNGLEEHINGRDHQTILYQIITRQYKRFATINSKYSCDICKIKNPRARDAKNHDSNRLHQENLKYIKFDELKSMNENLIDKTKSNEIKDVIISSIPNWNHLNLSEYIADFYILHLSKTVPRPLVLQKIGSNHFRCLVCKTMFIEGTSLNLHLSSEIHQRNYNNEKIQSALKIYHTQYVLAPKLNHEIFFFPHDNATIYSKTVYCSVCSLVVEFSKIKSHCKNKLHVQGVVDGNLWREIDKSLYHEESDRIENELFSNTNTFKKEKVFYLTEEFYSDDLLQKFDIKPHRYEKTILLSSPGVYNCLLCHEKNITSSLLERHCSSISHRSLMNSRYQNHIIRQFHNDWSNLPADLQLHQIYFLPNYKNYNCLLCSSDHIVPGSILSHVYGSKHVNNFKQLHPNAIPKCFDLINAPTQMRLYPESFGALVYDVKGSPADYISIQKLSIFEVKCLVCKIKFESIPSHLSSKDHKKLVQDKIKLKALNKYHKEWRKIPENLQIQQLNYEPYDEEHITCNKCNDFLKYENLHDHLTSNHKFIAIKTNIPVNPTQSEKEVTNNPKTTIPEHKFAPFTYYPIHLLQKMRKLEGKIYRNVQMISESNYRCLLCKMFVDNLDEHITISDHLKLLSKRELISSVEKFHNSWAIIDNNLQFQQMYFFPADDTTTSCVLCLKDINYNKLVPHLRVPQHSCLNDLKISNPMSSFSSSNPNLNSSTTSLNSLSKPNGTDSTDSNFNEDEDSDSDSSEESSDESDTEEVEKKLNNLSIECNDSDTKQILKLKEIWDSLPERLSAHRTVIYWKNGILSCHLCHINLEPNKDDIVTHIIRATHILMFKTTGLYERQWDRLFYECLHCNKKIQRSENDWQIHLKSKRHVELSNQKNFENFVEIYCKTCRTVLYGDKNILRDHKHAGRKAKNKEIKVPPYLQMLFKSSNNINSFIQGIHEEAMMVLHENKDEQVCEALIETMKPFCKNVEKCNAYRFGSRVTGLCTRDSDLDVFLDLNDVYNGNVDQEADTQANYVNYTHKILSASPKTWSHFEPVPNARTPILRVFHPPTNIDCDISFRHGLSVENTKLLCFYFDFQPVTRKVILFLKTWSAKFEFVQRINNYALSLMAIFYLQTREFMYSVSQLRKMYKGPPKMITGWDCTFYNDLENITPLPCNLSCIEILRDFFLYYAMFNYNEQVICPLLGRTIPKSDFHLSGDCDDLPDEMKCYKDYIQSNTEPELFRSLSSLCVQDPFDLSHNLTKAVPPHMVIKFSKACQISYKSLNDILNNHL